MVLILFYFFKKKKRLEKYCKIYLLYKTFMWEAKMKAYFMYDAENVIYDNVLRMIISQK